MDVSDPILAVAKPATVVSGMTTATFGFLQVSDIAILVGLFITVISFGFSTYFGFTKHIREKKLYRLQVEKIEGKV